jgi:hypothetical protein
MTKIIVRIEREPSKDAGTFGKLTIDGETFTANTLELPWRDNRTGVSSIPQGVYQCSYEMSPRFKRKLYRVNDVPGRSGILFHSGNFGGDKSKGLKSEIEGCILLGTGRGVLSGQEAVTSSKVAMDQFEKLLNGRPFELVITSK